MGTLARNGLTPFRAHVPINFNVCLSPTEDASGR